MSAPARTVPSRRAAPGRPRHAAQRPRLRPVPRPTSSRRTYAFYFLAGALLLLMILGLVTLNALLNQASFRIGDLRERIDVLQQRHDQRVLEVAILSAPQRLEREARTLGLERPVQATILHIPGGGAPRPGPEAVGGKR